MGLKAPIPEQGEQDAKDEEYDYYDPSDIRRKHRNPKDWVLVGRHPEDLDEDDLLEAEIEYFKELKEEEKVQEILNLDDTVLN